MSKIDEIKEKMKDEYRLIEADFYECDYWDWCYIHKDKVVKYLSELEPHLKTEKDLLLIELGKFVFDDLKMYNIGQIEDMYCEEFYHILYKLREMEK